MFKGLRISQKLYGVIILLIICIGALGVTSRILLNQVGEVNQRAVDAMAQVAMLDELEIAHLDWALNFANALNREQTFTGELDHTKCFDTLDHERIIAGVSKKVSDGRILQLVRQFLKAGVMKDGAVQETEIGSPQGGVISPLLANIYLDEFDQKMKALGIRIVRYADDILVFATSLRQAKKHQEIAIQILEEDLGLTVNRTKTHITSLSEGVSYLGFVIYPKCITIHPKRVKKFKDAVRRLTPRNHGKNVEQLVADLNRFLRGWIQYFRLANCKTFLQEVMGWIRRRLRMKKMREWKSWKGLHRTLRQRGYRGEYQKISMHRWRNSVSPLLSLALPNRWFREIGLLDLTKYSVGIVSQFYERR